MTHTMKSTAQRMMTLRRIEDYRRVYRRLLLQEMGRRETDRDAIRAAKVRMRPNLAHLSSDELLALQDCFMLEEQRSRRFANAVIV
jgi:hypothetical protein